MYLMYVFQNNGEVLQFLIAADSLATALLKAKECNTASYPNAEYILKRIGAK